MEKNKEPFYTKFVYEDKFLAIESGKEQQKYWVYYFSILVFAAVPALLSTFVGFSFQHIFSTIMFCWYIIFAVIAVAFSIKLGELENKYNIFKHKGFFVLSIVIPYILMVGIMIASIFTTKFHGTGNGAFSVSVNPVAFLFGFLPLWLGYIVFIYYAFMKCFAKFKREEKQ